MGLSDHLTKWIRALVLSAGVSVAGAALYVSTATAEGTVDQTGAPPSNVATTVTDNKHSPKPVSSTVPTDVSARSVRVSSPRAVLELFTSQACSSCPPADVILGDYTRDPTVIALTMPIDYWDYLGWKDTLADHRFTNRQKAYGQVRGDNTVYTPQMIINGVREAIGSDRRLIEKAITEAAQDAAVMSVPITLDVDRERIRIDVHGAGSPSKGGEVWIFAVTREIAIAVKRGENRGRALTYYNVVRDRLKVGNWSGGVATFEVPLVNVDRDAIDAAVVVLQTGTREAPGAMLGAKFTLLKSAAKTRAQAKAAVLHR